MSMSQGLEVRVPLIDHELAKAVLGLPGKRKVNGTPKKLLVEALGGSLPDEIVHRPKRGFTMPFAQWMRQELRAEIEPVLSAKKIAEGPLGSFVRRQRSAENLGRLSGGIGLLVSAVVLVRSAALVRAAFVN